MTSLYRRNVGGLDRGIRLVTGMVLVSFGLFAAGAARGEPLGIVLGIVGAVAVASGASGRCPAYALAGLSTVRPRGGAAPTCGCQDAALRGGSAHPEGATARASGEWYHRTP